MLRIVTLLLVVSPALAQAKDLAQIEKTRAEGRTSEALEDLYRLALDSKSSDARLIDLLGWRLLPTAAAQPEELRKVIDRLADLQESWLPVFAAVDALHRHDRAVLLRPIGQLPERFPETFAEEAHFQALRERGLSPSAAGLTVIRQRSFEALYLLRDLDRGLTREAEFLERSGSPDGAAQLRLNRDHLRAAYLKASRHVVERLFVHSLSGRHRERDALLTKARALPYMNDGQARRELFARLPEETAWRLIVQPLLQSEVAFFEQPPDLSRTTFQGEEDLQIEAGRREMAEKETRYIDNVRVRLGEWSIRADALTLQPATETTGVTLIASGNVRIAGITAIEGDVHADRMSRSTDTGVFTLEGDIRIALRDKILKLRSGTINRAGEIGSKRSLIDDFRQNVDTEYRLNLLPRIGRVYLNAEMPDDVRYWLAMSLLQSHLTWHAPYAPPPKEKRELRELRQEARQVRDNTDPWQEAHRGEFWMRRKIPDAQVEAFQRMLQERAPGEDPQVVALWADRATHESFVWRLRDPKHADVAQAIRLLESVRQGDYAGPAQHWLADLRRNNTVVTLEVAGGFVSRLDASVAVDIRNAEALTVALYKVAKADDLLVVTDRIGTDFIYRDHGLPHLNQRLDERERLKQAIADMKHIRRHERPARGAAAFLQQKPIERWQVNVADLESIPASRLEEFHDRYEQSDDEENYFDDECHEFADRLRKSYRPDRRALSTWQCDRVLKVPGRYLVEPGAYVIAVEANGHRALAPLIVEPLSLSLERCRDGVFVVAHDSVGFKPVEGARVVANGQLQEVKTDQAGAAFAKVFAAGDRAIIVEKDGRFAIGGFGRVFEGVYRATWEERQAHSFDRLVQEKRLQEASIYEDRFIVAAYTDRPTYRPGQTASFKFIVRQLAAANEKKEVVGFRADDFDQPSRLIIPDRDAPIDYAILDPKGRRVAHGALHLTEFGTASGVCALSTEAARGHYSLQLFIGRQHRLVPDLFAIEDYRRPTFELKLSGLPERPGDYAKLNLQANGAYYFGKPVAGGTLTLALYSADGRRPLEEAEAKLDAAGKATIEFPIPASLGSGKYQLAAHLRDESGRTVSRHFSIDLRRKNDPTPTSVFTDLPRFVAFGQPLTLKTSAKVITAEQGRRSEKEKGDEYRRTEFPARDGQVEIKFPAPGWYSLQAGDQSAEIFVFGGKEPPYHTWTRAQQAREDLDLSRRSSFSHWINLSRPFHDLDDSDNPGDRDLHALLDQQKVELGKSCRFLVYVPFPKARLMFTQEGHSVRDYHALTVENASSFYHVIDMPVRARGLPHFYLGGQIIAGEVGEHARRPLREQRKAQELERLDDRDGEDLVTHRIDVVDPAAAANAEPLRVTLTTAKPEYRPGDEVDVSLRVRDANDKPARAEVSLAAVDESIYTFGEDRIAGLASLFGDPHPAELLRRKTWRSVTGNRWKIQHDLLKHPEQLVHLQQQMMKALEMAQAVQRLDAARLELEKPELDRLSPARFDGLVPVSTVPLARLRVDFRETATWQPHLTTDAAGEIKTRFKLPDTLTRYRLTAVAVNTQAEIGSARHTIQARLPLAVQVILPRFAIESDRFTAFGMIHNTTATEQAVEYVWNVTGIGLDKKESSGMIKVPAGGTQRVDLPLEANQIGEATIALKVTSAEHADAEQRSLAVTPLGREREVVLEGRFVKNGKVTLPDGFTPREIRVVMARGEAARALEGLGYLVEYPYGCVEQTMSRFLPAVVVREASRQAPIHLAPEIAAKLPKVLEQGLARLYRFQHDDGGWGWWEKDATHDGMTAYVLQGLALCQRSGVAIDSEVFHRGCTYLKQRLQEGRLESVLAARGWYALSLAGKVQSNDLASAARQALRPNASPDEEILMALACKLVGRREEAELLARRVADWRPADAESKARLLQVRMAFGARLAECQALADALIQARKGERWASTQATAAAILALAEFTAYTTAVRPAKAVGVRVQGNHIAQLKDADALAKLVYRLDVPTSALRGERSLELIAEVDSPILYTVIARGIQKLDVVEASGKEVRMTRRRETLDGKPLDRPMKVGEVFAVRVTVELEKAEEFVIVEDRRPMNCEFADDQIAGVIKGVRASHEFRDDRVCIFCTKLEAGKHEFVYYLRAETPGVSHLLPGCAYPMYAEDRRGETGADRVEVKNWQSDPTYSLLQLFPIHSILPPRVVDRRMR